jgi:Rrf2 family protein
MSTLGRVKLSQGVEWGLHCATLLVLAPPGATIGRAILARHYGLPEAYLAKHLQAMARAGVLRATPGPKGGYQLARSADQITVLDVVEAIEGAAKPFLCQEIRQRGTGALPAEACRRPCAVHVIMEEAHQAWQDSLRQTTLADIAAKIPTWIRDRNQTLLTETP